MGDYGRELPFVEQLSNLIGLNITELSDPKKKFGGEMGVDVFGVVGEVKVGIQVTEYTPDKGQEPRPAKQSRGKEKKIAAANANAYGFSVSGQYIDALAARLKVKIFNTFASVDEGWLLIVAQNPNWGSTSSTFVAADHINVELTNECLHPLLSGSISRVPFSFWRRKTWCSNGPHRMPGGKA